MKNLAKLLFLCISISAFSQSPWTQEKGKFYTQLSFTTIPNYDTLFGDPDSPIPGEISDNTIQFFGEYGLSEKTSLVVNLPYKSISYSQNSIEHKESSLGNIELGLKHNFYKKNWLMSGQLSVEANTSSYDAISGIRTGYNAWSFTPLFLAGRGFGKTYVQGFIGANIRTNNYSSNFKIGGEIGRKITKKIWLIGFLDISKSLENGAIALPQTNLDSGLYVNDQEYGSFGFKGIGEFTDTFGITAGFGGAFFGNNVAKQAAMTFGLYHKF
jgi:hypothetical protein